MATLSTGKRIHYLRKKNRNLLEKLETHSSEIHSELKKLRGSLRGQRLRSNYPAKKENSSKTWVKRNGSKQVSEALCYLESGTVHDMKSSNRSSITTDQFLDKNIISEPCYNNTKSSAKCRCDFHQPEDSLSQKIIEANRKILSSIDYSPKSVFLRRMKSQYISQCFCDKQIDERNRKEHIADPEPLDCSASSPRKEESVSSCKSTVSGKKDTWREDGSEFERIKKFRHQNWTDCHAGNDENILDEEVEPKHKPVSAYNIWREKYRINERLFAEPTGLSCKNLVKCSHCLRKSTKTYASNANEVVVSIPSSLLDISNSLVDKKSENLKKRDSVMKLLTKRPKPCNSMALRYQKGIT